MKNKSLLRFIFILCVASLCLPWFTYNEKVMGYRWGLMFTKWYALPFALAGIYVFGEKKSELAMFLAEISAVAIIAVTVVLFGRWQELCNIAAGFRWTDGFRTAQPGFWIAAGLMAVLFALLQVEFCRWSADGNAANENPPEKC